MNTDYKIEAIEFLLNRDCVLGRYYPLIPIKSQIISFLKSTDVTVKNDCDKIPDEAYLKSGILDKNTLLLFKRFLSLYDVKQTKFKELDKLGLTPKKYAVYKEFYYLPGVKERRASLYYGIGLRSIKDIASALPSDIIYKCEEFIKRENSGLKPPLLKEVKTHIAVAKAFTF